MNLYVLFHFYVITGVPLFFCASFHKMAANFLRRNTTVLCRKRLIYGARTDFWAKRGCFVSLLDKIVRFDRHVCA